ncbi:MAG: DUF4270 family protein [Saprospiraceae bacterium]
MNKIILFSFLAIASFLAACTDATVIGGELVEGSQLPINYQDDTPIKLFTLPAKNTELTNGIQDAESGLPLGCIKSAYTGDLNSRVGMQIVERDSLLDLTTATIDSIVLILPLDTFLQIGDTFATTSLRVLGATAGSFSNPEPETSTSLLDNGVLFGEVTTVPQRQQTTATVFAGDSTRVDTIGPELRIRLNQTFSDLLLPALAASVVRDSLNDSLFIADFPGIVIEGSDCGGTLPAIDLSLSRNNRMGAFIYYTDNGVQRQYQLNYRRGSTSVGELRPEYVHDSTGTPAEELALNGPIMDSLAIVQSLSGLIVKVDFSDLSVLDNKAINAAFLEIPLVQGTEDVIRALPRILAMVENTSEDLVDYNSGAVDGTVPYSTSEGGSVIKIPDYRSTSNDSIFAYRFNLTKFLQDVNNGDRTPEIFLVPQFQSQLPGESILVGPGGDVNALRARLLLATTDLP